MREGRGYRYLIYALFLASGVAGLVYQIVWTRMLVLVFGNTMLATSTVLSAFMGGLAAGSFVLGRYIDSKPRPLIRVYAVLEAGIGLFALLFPLLLDAVTPLYAAIYGGVAGNVVLLNLARFAVCFALIVVPTFLMGGTLPVLIKRFSGVGSSLGHQTGFLYGLNTVGAVLGTVACGYYLLRVLGMQKTTWVAVAINLGVAAVAWLVGRLPRETPGEPAPLEKTVVPVAVAERIYSRATVRMVLVGIGLSGFCALAYEVFWTRMLNLFLHNNIYSFTAILATFLVGIATGSLFYARFLSRMRHQVGLFIGLQVGIGLISYVTPYVFRWLQASLFNDFSEALTLAKTSVIMIGPTVMMGIAVPLAIQICQRGEHHEGTSVGTVYAVNTVGAIFGAFSAGFVLLPTVGLHMGVILVASANILGGFLPLVARARPATRPAWSLGFVGLVAALVLTAPPDLFRSLFQAAHPNADIIHYKEGRIANVLVYDFKKLGYKDFHLNAVNEASSRLWHVQLFKLLGLLPTLVHEEPDDALMIAFGAGMSAGAASTNVTSLDVVDLNPDIAGIAAAFTRENLDVYHRPNFRQVVNDGRNALLLDDRKYSLIISDATNPKMFDSWTLYSKEFYELVRDRLEPGGVFCQWALIPLPADSIKVLLNTFRSVFPHASFWVIHGSTQVLMLATPERLEIDYADLERRLEPLLDDAGLRDYGVDGVEKFLSFFQLGEDGLDRMLQGFDKVSTDDLPHAQFHVAQDAAGIDHCLDLVRYQESILPYMTNLEAAPEGFVERMKAHEDIARRLDLGFLLEDPTRYSQAEVVAYDAGIDDANIAHLMNHCPEKKRYFLERLETHPDDLNARNTLGNIYRLDGQLDEARAQLRAALDRKPDYAYARINLALVDRDAGDFDAAVDGFLAVREMSPTKRILTAVPQQLRLTRLYRRLAREPESAVLHVELGRELLLAGEMLDGVLHLRRAAELSDDDPAVLADLGRLYETHELVTAAADLYGKLALEDPGKLTRVGRSLQIATLAADPERERAWLNERLPDPTAPGSTSADSGEHPPSCDEGLALWQDADPEGVVPRENLVRAAELYARSTRVQPDDAHAYRDAAWLYEAIGDYRQAAEMWQKLLELRPDIAVGHEQARRLTLMAELEQAPDSGPERAELLARLGHEYRAVGEPERAVEVLREAADLAPRAEGVRAELTAAMDDAGM